MSQTGGAGGGHVASVGFVREKGLLLFFVRLRLGWLESPAVLYIEFQGQYLLLKSYEC